MTFIFYNQKKDGCLIATDSVGCTFLFGAMF